MVNSVVRWVSWTHMEAVLEEGRERAWRRPWGETFQGEGIARAKALRGGCLECLMSTKIGMAGWNNQGHRSNIGPQGLV